MIRGLTQVCWERVDVRIKKSLLKYNAHKTIQASLVFFWIASFVLGCIGQWALKFDCTVPAPTKLSYGSQFVYFYSDSPEWVWLSNLKLTAQIWRRPSNEFHSTGDGLSPVFNSCVQHVSLWMVKFIESAS